MSQQHQQHNPEAKSTSSSGMASKAEASIMSMAPLKNISHHLACVDVDTVDRTRAVPVHLFAGPSPCKGVRQGMLFDSDKQDARLIGVEYLIDEEVYQSLPAEEKKLWCSLKNEVEKGMCQIGTKSMIPGTVEDKVEQGLMKELLKSYSKCIHTWHVDKSPQVPVGCPYLMSTVSDSDTLSPSFVSDYEKARGNVSLKHHADARAKYLDQNYVVKQGCDASAKEGKGVELIVNETEVKRGQCEYKGQGQMC